MDYTVPLTLRFRKSKKTNRWAVAVIQQPLPGSPYQGEPDVIEDYVLHVLTAPSTPAPVELASITPTPSSLSLTVGTADETVTFLAVDTLGRPVTNTAFQITVSDPTKFTADLAVVFTDSQGIGTFTVHAVDAATGETLTIALGLVDADITVDVATAPVVVDSVSAEPATLNLVESGENGNVTITALDDQGRPYDGLFNLSSSSGDATVPATATTVNGTATFAVTPVAEGSATITVESDEDALVTDTVAVTIAAAGSPPVTALDSLIAAIASLGGTLFRRYDEQYNVTGDPASSWTDAIDDTFALTSPGTAQPDVDANGHLVFDSNAYLRHESASHATEIGTKSILATYVGSLVTADGGRYFEVSNGASARFALLCNTGFAAGFVNLGSSFAEAPITGLVAADPHVIHFQRIVSGGSAAAPKLRIGNLTEVTGGASSFALTADHNRLTVGASRANTPASFGQPTVRAFFLTNITGLSATTVNQIIGLLNDYAESELGATIDEPPPTPAPFTITPSPTSVTVQVGGSAQSVTVTVRDVQGFPVAGEDVNVVSSDTGLATVSSALITTGAAGTASFSISPVAEGTPTVNVSCDSDPSVEFDIPVNVLAAAPPDTTVASVVVVPSSATFEQGQGTVFEAFARNAAGQNIDEPTFTWQVSGTPGIVSLTAFGLGKQVLADGDTQGSTAIRATCNGVVSAPVPITVVAPGTLGQFYLNTNIERPRFVPSFAYPTASRTVNVSTQAEFNTAITNRLPGDRIVFAEGINLSTWTQVTLPDNPSFTGTQWVQITVTGHATEFGTYSETGTTGHYMAGPTKKAAGKTACLRPAVGTSAFVFANGARGWWIGPGLEFTKRTGTTSHQQAVAFTIGGTTEPNPANHPERVVIDRNYIHADGGNVRGAIRIGGRNVAIVGNDIRGLKEPGFETHGMLGGNSPGPYLIHNNRAEATGIGSMWGGADPASDAMIPRDVTITNNFLTKDPAWLPGTGLSMKNHYENKVGIRFRVEGNVMSRGPGDGQTGMAVNLKSVNQNGPAIWNKCRDIAMIRNKIYDSGWMWSLASAPQNQVAEPLNRVLIEENLVFRIDGPGFGGSGYTYQFDGGLNYIVVRHNTNVYHPSIALTGSNNNTALMVRKPTLGVGFVHEDNVIQHRDFGWFTDSGGQGGTAALNALFVNSGPGAWVWRNNVYIRGPSASYPSGNYFPTTESGVFVNYAGGDLHLTATAAATFTPATGSIVGCDIDALEAAVAGVERP